MTYDWVKRLFVDNADIYLKIMDSLWSDGDMLAEGIARVLRSYGLGPGARVLDLFCGNGRVSVNLAKRGFEVTGVDISFPFVMNAREKAEKVGVKDRTNFIAGDVRELRRLLKPEDRYDVVLIVWSSLGYYDEMTDLEVLKQAREFSEDNAVLVIADTIHRDLVTGSGYNSRRTFTMHGDVLLLEKNFFNPLNSKMISDWMIYEDEGTILKKKLSITIEVRIYTVTELVNLLRQAGWGVDSIYGDLRRLQPFNPSTSRLNLVARAL